MGYPSPPSHIRHRSQSPPPASRRDDVVQRLGESSRRSEYRERDTRRERDRYDDDCRSKQRQKNDDRGSDRDRYRDRRDDRDRDRDRDRRRSRSPMQADRPTGGDGGWGKQHTHNGDRQGNKSPGRPSLSLDRRKNSPLPSQSEAMGGKAGEHGTNGPPPVKPIEPNFAPSGALAAETNTLRGVVLKYNEPPEARKPTKNWRLYAFKGKEQVDLFHVHRQSAYLIGRDRIVVDIPIDHPSASKQHAVLQFRQVVERNEFGDTKSLTKPFIIDLESANGTTVNEEAVPPSRFYELKTGDVLKFAFSTREYVLLVES